MRGEEAAKPRPRDRDSRRHQRLGFVVARQCHSSGRPSKAMNTPGRTLHSRCQTHPPAMRQADGNSCRFDRLAALLRQGSGGRPASRLSAGPVLRSSERAKQDGGARRDRTDDLMLAKHALYQLSYGPPKAYRPQRRIIGELSSDPRVLSGSHPTLWSGGPRQTRTADLTLIRRVL